MEIRKIRPEEIVDFEDDLKNLIHENVKLNFCITTNIENEICVMYNNMIKFTQDGSAIILAAFEDKKIIGFVWAFVKNAFGEKKLHLLHIIVDAKNRSKGIGQKLIQSLQMISLNMKVVTIELMATVSNLNAMAFYEKNGFRITRVLFEKQIGENDEN
jgi:ribosomal protein S18 acetylase RimI-like enzyme